MGRRRGDGFGALVCAYNLGRRHARAGVTRRKSRDPEHPCATDREQAQYRIGYLDEQRRMRGARVLPQLELVPDAT